MKRKKKKNAKSKLCSRPDSLSVQVRCVATARSILPPATQGSRTWCSKLSWSERALPRATEMLASPATASVATRTTTKKRAHTRTLALHVQEHSTNVASKKKTVFTTPACANVAVPDGGGGASRLRPLLRMAIRCDAVVAARAFGLLGNE